LHTIVPIAHDAAHAPAAHTWPEGQAAPQAPQLAPSLSTLVQTPLHTFVPSAQVAAQAPLLQTWPCEQAFPQAPQF